MCVTCAQATRTLPEAACYLCGGVEYAEHGLLHERLRALGDALAKVLGTLYETLGRLVEEIIETETEKDEQKEEARDINSPCSDITEQHHGAPQHI